MEKSEKKPSPLAKVWEWGKAYHKSFLGAVLLAAAGVACGMVPYFCIARMMGFLYEGIREWKTYEPLLFLSLAGYVGKTVLAAASTAVSHKATYYTLRDLRKNLLVKLSRVPMGTILDVPSGQYKTTIVDRVEGMEPTLAHLIPEMTANILVPAAIFLYIFVLDWRMALASVVTLVIGMMFASQSGKTYASKWEGAVEVGRRMANAIVEYIGGIQVVKAFSQSAGSYRKYADAVNDNARYYVQWMRENQKYMCMWTAVIPAVLVTILPFGYLFWMQGSLAATEFFTIIVLSLGLTGPLIAAMSFVDDLAVVGTNVEEINGILEAKELCRPETPVTLASEEIALKNVIFSYGKDKAEILHGVNLTMKPGTVTALVGPSGSGKSTIAKLIAGFWDVSGGSITMGGTDIRQIPMEQYNRQIAYVSQDTYLFNRTVRENIRMGRADATDAEVVEAAQAAGCDGFIRKLGHGYETMAGGGGGHLSGGEKQRISIARAMLKDAPVVILDEATASIDPENEALIQKALSVLTKGKTLIVIAHRLSTIADADQIAVIKDGNVLAKGRQEKLLSSCPLYAKMWKEHMDSRDQA